MKDGDEGRLGAGGGGGAVVLGDGDGDNGGESHGSVTTDPPSRSLKAHLYKTRQVNFRTPPHAFNCVSTL